MRWSRTHSDRVLKARLRELPAAQPTGWTPGPALPERAEVPVSHGWVPDQEARPEPARRGESDALDEFLAEHGVDGFDDVDDWAVPEQPHRRIRLDTPWRVAAACAVLVLIVGCALAGWTWLNRPGPTTAIPAAPTTATAPATGTGLTPAPTASSAGSTVVVVDVVGAVGKSGLVKLPAGSRVADAIAAAGGARAGADLRQVNLARPLTDGEQVVVPLVGETATPVPGTSTAPGAGTGTSSGNASGTVDLNTATAQQLEALPGVGPALSKRILDYRTANGRFSSVDQLGDVSGIGDKLLAKLRPLVRV